MVNVKITWRLSKFLKEWLSFESNNSILSRCKDSMKNYKLGQFVMIWSMTLEVLVTCNKPSSKIFFILSIEILLDLQPLVGWFTIIYMKNPRNTLLMKFRKTSVKVSYMVACKSIVWFQIESSIFCTWLKKRFHSS